MRADVLDPRLRALDALVGEWDLHHRDVNTGETWAGHDRFAWMDGGFFLTFEHEEFGKNIKGTMIIGFERRWGEEHLSEAMIGHWFESSTGNHFVYFWEIDDQTVRFSFEKPTSSVRFFGALQPGSHPDRRRVAPAGWRRLHPDDDARTDWLNLM